MSDLRGLPLAPSDAWSLICPAGRLPARHIDAEDAASPAFWAEMQAALSVAMQRARLSLLTTQRSRENGGVR